MGACWKRSRGASGSANSLGPFLAVDGAELSESSSLLLIPVAHAERYDQFADPGVHSLMPTPLHCRRYKLPSTFGLPPGIDDFLGETKGNVLVETFCMPPHTQQLPGAQEKEPTSSWHAAPVNTFPQPIRSALSVFLLRQPPVRWEGWRGVKVLWETLVQLQFVHGLVHMLPAGLPALCWASPFSHDMSVPKILPLPFFQGTARAGGARRGRTRHAHPGRPP